MFEDHNTESGVIAEVMKKNESKTVDLTKAGTTANADAQVLIVPNAAGGVEVKSIKPFLDEYREMPERKSGTAALLDLESFVAHANRFKDKDSAIFANRIGKFDVSLTSVIDYHQAGPDPKAARFGKHRGVYKFPVSEEWRTWLENDGKLMKQADFAEFIEGNITEIAYPDSVGDSAKALSQLIGAPFASPSEILNLSRGLSIRVGAKLHNKINLTTGEAQMQFTSEHQDESGAPLKVPGAFLLSLAVFDKGELWQVAARLRYRVSGGDVVWFYELHQADKRFDAAFKEACAVAQRTTELPLFYGSPE